MITRKHKHKANRNDKYSPELESEFNKEIEEDITWNENRNRIENLMSQLEKSKKNLISVMNQDIKEEP